MFKIISKTITFIIWTVIFGAFYIGLPTYSILLGFGVLKNTSITICSIVAIICGSMIIVPTIYARMIFAISFLLLITILLIAFLSYHCEFIPIIDKEMTFVGLVTGMVVSLILLMPLWLMEEEN